MKRLLPLLAACAAWSAFAGSAAAAGPLSIVEPTADSVLRGKVQITASEAVAADSVTFDWSSDGKTWRPIGVDSVPSDGFGAVWDTTGYTGRALLRASDSLGNQTHVRVRVDNTAPSIVLTPSTSAFSPNGDGRDDTVALRITSSEASTLKLQLVGPRGLVVENLSSTDALPARRTAHYDWGGKIYDGARRGADGLYTVRAVVADAAGNDSTASTTVRVDTRAPKVTRLSASQGGTRVGVRFSVVDADDRITVRPKLVDQYGSPVSSAPPRVVAPGSVALAIAVPAVLMPGAYRVEVTASDEAGNRTDPAPETTPFLYTHAVRAHVWGRFDGVGRSVALTFDDCYDGGGWAGVLDVLAAEKVKATFFCTGQAVLANQALGLRTIREGHVVGSHGWDHADFSKLSFDSSVARLVDDRNVWWNLARVVPMPFFRPPYGAYTPTTIAAAGAAGYSAVILWDVDPFDWKNPGVGTIVARIVGATTPGAIDLMHTLPETAAALPTIIDDLRARGYSFMTLPEMAALGTPTPGHWRDY
jgi:peptidoglycan/xylan/chitin deacetylase (PgdA/CDA1 family)